MYLDILHVENRGGEAAAFWEEKRRKERGRSEEGKGKKEVKGLRPSASAQGDTSGKKVQGKNSVSRACNCDRGRREVGVGDGSGAATGSAWLGVTC
ncbi:hypothetical protein BHM03_00037198 [Ensete ventricosum]|nr:hypothetical protein BHM03_00037198 [Ensete ventricosum]